MSDTNSGPYTAWRILRFDHVRPHVRGNASRGHGRAVWRRVHTVTPTEELKVLAARYRTGEDYWTFNPIRQASTR